MAAWGNYEIPETIGELVDLPTVIAIKAWKEGNDAAACVIYQKYVRLVNSIARDRINDRFRHRVDIEDVTQTVFGVVFAHLLDENVSFDSEVVFRRWLGNVARNVAITEVEYHQRQCRDVAKEQPIEASACPRSTLNLDDNDDLAGRHLVQLTAAIEALEEKDRQLLQMLYFQNLPQREVAQHFGVTDRTIRRRRQMIISLLQGSIN